MDYWPHLAGKYTSNFTHHSITNLKVLTIFYDSCVCGLSCDCALNCETTIRRNATAPIVETICYFNRKIGLPDLGITSFRVPIYQHLTTTICYSIHAAVCNSSFSKPFSSTAELFIKDHAKSRITRAGSFRKRRNVQFFSTYIY